MRDCVEIEIIINDRLIFNLHETITSIIEQTNRDNLNIHILIHNPNNLGIDQEKSRLIKSGIKLINQHSNARFTLTLKSGEIISRSFLYKGTHFLKSNPAHFVCPEYTFQRIENTLVITTVVNNQMLCNRTSANLFDHQKFQNHLPFSPRANIVKDTCSASHTINISIPEYINNIKNETPYFNSPLFAHLDITYIDEPAPFAHKEFRTLKKQVKSIIESATGKSKLAKKLFLSNTKHTNHNTLHSQTPPYISNLMRDELDQLSTIKYGLKGYHSMEFIDITYEVFLQSEQLLNAYRIILKKLDFKDYSYIMILPWLISGGVDLFATNYLHTLSKLLPDQHILVFLTNGAHKSFNKEELDLPANITLIDLPSLFKSNKEILRLFPQLIYSFINTFCPDRIHIIASKAGYECLEQYGDIIRKKKVKILFSSYNYLVGPHGEYTGYTVQELPMTYRPGDTITTDNNASRNLWINHCGFIPNDILVHQQLFKHNPCNTPKPSNENGTRILWAAHIRPEKNPDILPIIAEALRKDKIHIDCYGLFSPMNWPDGNNPLDVNIPNLHYKGAYHNFFNDINLTQYDLFLYTSYADGTPNVIIEAALSGLPIVSSNIGGIPEALGNNAILVDDPSSPDQFIQSIRHTLSNLSSSLEKARSLQKTLQKKHNEAIFIKQVKEMLDRSKHA